MNLRYLFAWAVLGSSLAYAAAYQTDLLKSVIAIGLATVRLSVLVLAKGVVNMRPFDWMFTFSLGALAIACLVTIANEAREEWND